MYRPRFTSDEASRAGTCRETTAHRNVTYNKLYDTWVGAGRGNTLNGAHHRRAGGKTRLGRMVARGERVYVVVVGEVTDITHRRCRTFWSSPGTIRFRAGSNPCAP